MDTYCFRAPYVASLLRQGLAVSDADVHIGSGNVAWTLGGRSWLRSSKRACRLAASTPSVSR